MTMIEYRIWESPSSGLLRKGQEFSNLEEGTDILSRNVGNKLQLLAP